MSAGSTALQDSQSLRVPAYPAWAIALLFSEWSTEPELVRVPFDIGSADTRTPGDVDFDEWLDVFQNNVVNNSDYITEIPNEESDHPHAFAILSNRFDEEISELNIGVKAHLGVHFVGRILILAVDASHRVVDLTLEDGPIVDHHLTRAITAEKVPVVFSVEIMGMVLQLCSMATVACFAGVSHKTAAIVMDFLRSKIMAQTALFLPANSLDTFFNLLKDTGAGVVGSVATSLFCTNIVFAGTHLPKDFNLLVPVDTHHKWVAWLLAHNAERLRDVPLLRRHKAAVRQFSVFEVLTAGGHKTRVTLSESRTPSILVPLLGSELSSQMTILTATHLVCLYAESTPFLRSVLGWVPRPSYSKRLTKFQYGGFDIVATAEAWGKKCGEACPFLWRRINGPGFAEVTWGGFGGREGGGENPLRAENLRWRLGRMCDNQRCKNFSAGFRF